MSATRPGSRGFALPLSFAVLAVLLGALGSLTPARTAQAQVFSPGPLAAAHASLEGDSHCDDCHVGGKRVDEAKCMVCHTLIKKDQDAKRGLHGKAFRAKACGTCHVEHIGKNAHLIRWPDGDEKKFDHPQTGFKLTGKHAATECRKCHDRKSERGAPSFLGLSRACKSCHQDPHEGRLGDDCAKCHDTTDWKKPAIPLESFDHSKTRFPLRGKHLKVACKDCHHEPPQYKDIPFAKCSDCHADPHKGKFKDACSACHTEKGWKIVSLKRGDHPGLSLANGHARVRCEKCHDRGNDREPSKGSTCVSCHRAVHKAPFGNDCKTCHADILWLGIPREISLTAHAKTAYPLEGKHVAVGCASCHDPKKPAEQRFRRLSFGRCTSCHADKHGGEFARRGAECSSCHRVEGFAPTTFTAAMHGKTDFPLDGRHQAVPCAGCHTAKRPRLDWRNAKRACAECHANPHGDQFAKEMAQGGCAKCHTTETWARVNIDHSIFPLLGAHAKTACSGCHNPSPEDLKQGKGATWRGVPHECEACHADPHGGQFREAAAGSAPAKGCAECHGNESFEIKPFDHLAKTGFAIDGKHAALACEKCHPTERRKDGVRSVRWRLGYRRCRDCHADPHGE